MPIMINRFESKIMKNDAKIIAKSDKSVKIIDHSNDEAIVVVNLCKTSKDNIALANKIIETIETFIESDGDVSENQH